MLRKALLPIPLAAMLLALGACGGGHSTPAAAAATSVQDAAATTTPIKHLVVIYGENVSFDHYFGTYPTATNPANEPVFTPVANTPAVNGLSTSLLNNNPNFTNAQNAALTPPGNFNPFRLDRSQANTADQNHGYMAEQQAYDGGLMDLFPKFTGKGTAGSTGAFGTQGQVMGYFDGNTATALWNYAQNFAMSDNAYTDTYGPSTPGALEVVSGQTNGATPVVGTAATVPDTQGGLTLIGDTDPAGDICSSTTSTVQMTSKNIGDLLNAKGLTWGGFMGGFNLTTVNPNNTTNCKRSTFSSVLNASPADYVPHHAWFQYFKSTANPQHTRPSATAAIGFSVEADGKTPEPANHEYDTDDFFASVQAGNFPSVSYLKAPSVGDAHPGNSDPLDEQAFVTKVVNFLEQQPDWKNTAVIITYDDSDGWYDHQFATPTSASFDPTSDQLDGAGVCSMGATAPTGLSGGTVNGRCGPGTRIPFIVISPWARINDVDNTQLSQASVVRFIEDNWLGGQRLGQGSFDANAGSIMSLFDFNGGGKAPVLFLDPTQGTKLAQAPQS